MQRVTIRLPSSLKEQVEQLALERGVSFSSLVRDALSWFLRESKHAPSRDPLFADHEVWTGETPADLAENHDADLFGRHEILQALARGEVEI